LRAFTADEEARAMTKKLIPDPEVCRRYGIHSSTLYNWDHNPELKFPKPVRINNRKFRAEHELDEFDQARADERELTP
jgi:predicted DNA-binding transcriptional regulator AlpA